MRINIPIILFLLIMQVQLLAQIDEAPHIRITGVVYDIENNALLSNLMIINKSTQQGYFAGATGNFNATVSKNDTLIIAASGYQNKKICFRDSILKEDYFIRVYMERLTVQLKEVKIIASRDLDAIQRDIDKLGYKKSDYMTSGVDAISSPITFLYEQFSKRERSRRHIAELRNEDRKRDLLKELLTKYVANDVINLSDDEFDNFIDYCNVSDEFMKNSTQYEFIMYIKRKYEFYRLMK